MTSHDRLMALLMRATRGDPERISVMQRRLGRRPFVSRTASDYLRSARWWELEACRGYTDHVDERGEDSSARSRRYARNSRWAAELAAEHGPGTWLELLVRSGNPHPDYPTMDVERALDDTRRYAPSGARGLR